MNNFIFLLYFFGAKINENRLITEKKNLSEIYTRFSNIPMLITFYLFQNEKEKKCL